VGRGGEGRGGGCHALGRGEDSWSEGSASRQEVLRVGGGYHALGGGTSSSLPQARHSSKVISFQLLLDAADSRPFQTDKMKKTPHKLRLTSSDVVFPVSPLFLAVEMDGNGFET
jgi:hypothetical protein